MNIRIIESEHCQPGSAYVLDSNAFKNVMDAAAVALLERGEDALPEAIREAIARVREYGGEPFAVVHNAMPSLK